MATAIDSKIKVVDTVMPGAHRDLMSLFRKDRREKLKADVAKIRETICCSMFTSSKYTALLYEIDRLMKGFATNVGFLRGLASEIMVPEWQRSATWIEPGNANQCYRCRKTFTLLTSKKNCRIGGQVFCAQCIKKEGLIIYQDDKEDEPKWGINGKDNGQKRKYRFETYAICSSCSDNLEIVLAKINQKNTFTDSAFELYQRISRMQTNVEKWLPEYQQEVDLVNLGKRNISKEAEGKLARLHLNLSSTLSAIKSNVNDLLKLYQQLESKVSDQQQTLLKRFLIRFEASHQEHKQQFHCTNEQLPKQILRKQLQEIQEERSQKSMVYVYTTIQKLVADLTDYNEHFNLDKAFLEDIKAIELAITEELKPWPKRLSWEQHFSAMKEKPSGIHIAQMVTTSANHDHVKIIIYTIASQSLTIMQECSSKLKDETLDLEFQETKRTLKQAWNKLEMTLIQFNRMRSA